MKTLIITGGNTNTIFLKNFVNNNHYDYIIGVDKGADYLYEASLRPNLILGDFDSADHRVIERFSHDVHVEVRRFAVEKDETDTHLAILEAIHRGSSHIDIFGGIGSRMDHTLANIHILKIPLEKGVTCRIVNENNMISLIDTSIHLKINDYKYLSLIPLTDTVTGITTKGLKYELNGYTMKQGISIGISNEFLKNEATVSIDKGLLIIIRSRD